MPDNHMSQEEVGYQNFKYFLGFNKGKEDAGASRVCQGYYKFMQKIKGPIHKLSSQQISHTDI